jgi:hypothetical protein
MRETRTGRGAYRSLLADGEQTSRKGVGVGRVVDAALVLSAVLLARAIAAEPVKEGVRASELSGRRFEREKESR